MRLLPFKLQQNELYHMVTVLTFKRICTPKNNNKKKV